MTRELLDELCRAVTLKSGSVLRKRSSRLRNRASARAVLTAGLVLACAPAAQAQSFELTQSQPSAGGGISSGGEFSLTGTMAQVAAAPTSGGEFDVLGGFTPACDTACRLGDVDCDGFVDANDLAALLSSWGPCPGGACPSDFDGDGIVGAEDLAILLSEWD